MSNSRWLEWEPTRVIGIPTEAEPKKPKEPEDQCGGSNTEGIEPGSLGFLGSIPAEKPITRDLLDSHQVARIVWRSEAAIIFQDEVGAFWRYLHAYKKAWPVVYVRKGEN